MEIFIDVNENRSEKVSYDNAEYPIHMRHSCLNSYPGYAAPPHWHDDIEFPIILKGSMTYNVNGELTELNSQEGIFVNSRQVHLDCSLRRYWTEQVLQIIQYLYTSYAQCLSYRIPASQKRGAFADDRPEYYRNCI